MTYVEVHTTACHAGSDGDCSWSDCPQARDGEPKATGRHCPLDAVPVPAWAAPNREAPAAGAGVETLRAEIEALPSVAMALVWGNLPARKAIEDIFAVLDSARAALSASPSAPRETEAVTLDEAWARVMVALPEGWWRVGVSHGGAFRESVAAINDGTEGAMVLPSGKLAVGIGPDPGAALNALAARLSAPVDGAEGASE